MGQHNFFWDWFLRNSDRIEAYHSSGNEDANSLSKDESDSDLLDEIVEQLHYYNDKLYFEVSTTNSVNEFIITAEGDVEQFSSVSELVSRAPKMKNWEFKAFKAGVGFGFYTEYAGVDYNPDELWFLPLSSKSSDSNLGLRIGIPNFSDADHEYSEEAMWVILETALGELECAENIRYVEVGSLPQAPDEMGYIELVELKEFIDWYKENASQI